jgi:hypothetical protein
MVVTATKGTVVCNCSTQPARSLAPYGNVTVGRTLAATAIQVGGWPERPDYPIGRNFTSVSCDSIDVV